MHRQFALVAAMLLLTPAFASAADDAGLGKGVRGLVTRAAGPVKIDGTLDDKEWASAFCTPVHYNHARVADRAAQFLYLWDDDAFYVGLRALDKARANVGNLGSLWNGDAVEFYFDTRQGEALRGKDWTDGAIHFFYTPFEGKDLKPRWVMRGGIATSNTKLEGVEVAARNTDWGYEIEFKLPWKNFPQFKPKAGARIGIDAELCSGDGGGRTDRTFAYGSPLSVTQPASQGLVQLVDKLEDRHLAQVGAATFPCWVETPWSQPQRAQVVAVMALPPEFAERVDDVTVRIHDVEGKVIKEIAAKKEKLPGPNFTRARATWANDDYAPGTFFVTFQAKAGKQVLATVAPRLVQEAQMSGR